MLRKTAFFLLAAAASLIVAGCGQAGQAGPAVTPMPATKTPKPTFTATVDWTPTQEVFATFTPEPPAATPEAAAQPEATGEAAAATAAPTEAPAAEVRFTARQNVNVRSGPGTAYGIIGRLSAGDSHPVIATNSAGDWLQFELDGKQGWVTAGLVDVSGDASTIEVAQDIAPPPTARPRPTARPQPAPQPQPAQPAQPAPAPAPVQPSYPFSLVKGAERCDPNEGTTYFNGFVRNRDNSPINGACVHIAFYGPRQTKCSGCGNVGDGVWGFSPFGGAKPQAGTTVEIYMVTCDGVPAGGQDENTGFGNLTPQSDKWVHTLNSGEQCTGITFVKN
jgi:hypothetical protein